MRLPHIPGVLVVALLVVAVVVAFVWLGPNLAVTIAARALIASIVYRLVRRAIR